jgi:cobalt-zinc-cadmium efflux system membrane fusion protein
MDEDNTVRVLSPLAGRIRTLDAPLGAEVAAGAALAHIASGDMAQAASDLYKARAAAVQSAAAYARAQDLYQHHVLALKDLEQARSDEETARAELARAQARLRVLGASGGTVGADYVLRAPITGVIVDRTANPGAEVRPDNATPLFTITSLDMVWLTANVYQHELAAIRAGERLQFTTDAVPGRRFDATITYVSSTLDPQTRTALVRAAIPNPGHLLRPQTFGTARLVAGVTGTSPVVPSTALVTVGNDKCVFVEVGPGRFRRRPVTVGDDDGEYAEITAGLSQGDRVVTVGSILLLGIEEQS